MVRQTMPNMGVDQLYREGISPTLARKAWLSNLLIIK